MATRWRVLHRRKKRAVSEPTRHKVSVFSPPLYEGGWFDYDDDDDDDGDCACCGGEGWIDGYDDDPLLWWIR